MDFRQALKEELKLPLPGITSQLKMAPKHRQIEFDGIIKQNAAVSIVIIPSEKEELGILLIKRPEYDGHHSGQISFPGGKEEHEDEDLLQTAIRETHEEIGIKINRDSPLGSLTPLYIPVSGFMVHPYVFFEYGMKEFRIDPNEVEYIIHLPIKELMDDSIVKTTRIEIGNRIITTPYFNIEGEIVWGATAMMLSEFVEILYRLKRKNPDLW
jgi:8-oxo-dGTP pyrophosphatase MutT (NUDIX family)